MAQLVVRNLEEDVKARLRVRAAKNGRSMEEEVRAILRQAVSVPTPETAGLGTRIAALFSKHGLQPDEILPNLDWGSIQPARFDDC